MEHVDLFGNNSEQIRIGRGHEIKWRFVTNHLNMMFMLSAGMILPPSAFGKKYYTDTLSFLPGWIPLFPETLSQSALKKSVSEQSHLRPCYLELNLNELHGQVKVFRAGRWLDVSFPEGVFGDEEAMLVPAPLPVTLINEIVFSSKEDKTYCEKDAKNFFNVPLADFKTKSVAAPFKKSVTDTWSAITENLAVRQINHAILDALGGVLALLSILSIKDDTAIALARGFFQENPSDDLTNTYSMLLGAHSLFYSSVNNTESSVASGILFKEIAHALIKHRESYASGSAKDIVMAVLERSNQSLHGQMKQASERLIEDLRAIVQFPDKSLGELLQLHQKPLPRSLILFFMSDSVLDFLELDSDKLSGYELCGAAILLGIAEGWMRMPSLVREINGLNNTVPSYMAGLSLKLSKEEFSYGSLPERPHSLREFFLNYPFDKKTNEAALHIARACKWPCIKTRIKLGKGDYQLSIEGSSVSILLDGDVNAVVSEIEHGPFLSMFCGINAIPAKVEREARIILDK